MSDSETCARCGAPLELASSGGDVLCARCLARSLSPDAAEDTEYDSPRLALPRPFGAYELLEEIGRGGMGVVYRARQLALDRPVAVKLLLAGAYSSEVTLRRFRLEAAAAARLQHPSIVPIHDYGECDGQPYYAMDLIAGPNLADLCRGQPLLARRAAKLISVLAGAVQHAHDAGIVHRDLKPSNILVDVDGQPHITDFGLAKRLDRVEGVTVTGQMVGSPSYVAPEQAAGRDVQVGVASDVYGLGALLYHLATGRAPFFATTPTDTLRLVIETDPPPPRLLNPALPRDLETICLKCLAKEPARRYATAAELGEDLERFLENRPIRARPPSVTYRTRKFVRHYRTGVVAVAAVFVTLLAGLAGTFISYRRAMDQKRETDAARARSQQVVNFIMQDLQPQLQALGRRRAMIDAAKTAVSYFEQLPPKLRDRETMRAHATALDLLATTCWHNPARSVNDYAAEAQEAGEKALAIWRQLTAEDPDDPEAVAAVLEDEFWTGRDYSHPGVAAYVQLTKENLAGLQKLERRFPGHRTIQRRVADRLWRLAMSLALVGEPEEGIALGKEACARVEQMLAEAPGDHQLRYDLFWAWRGLGSANYKAGHTEAAVQAARNTVMLAERLLSDDPGNIRYLDLATLSAQFLVWGDPSEKRRAELVPKLRSYTRRLMDLDPEEPEWNFREIYALGSAMGAFLGERRFAEAREAVDTAIALTETLPFDQSHVMRGNCIRLAGGVCDILAGDLESARDRLELLRSGFNDWIDDAGDPDIARFRKYYVSFWQCDIIAGLNDGSELERLARDMLVQADECAEHAPGESLGFPVFQVAAEGYLGRALLMQGHAEEAIAPLEHVVAFFRSAKSGSPFNEYMPEGSWIAAENLADALLQTGKTARAVEALEWAFGMRDVRVRAGGLLLSRIAAAQTAWQLAQALDPDDPAQATRRQEVLERALELLDDPETAPRLTPEEQKLRAQVAAALAESPPKSRSREGV